MSKLGPLGPTAFLRVQFNTGVIELPAGFDCALESEPSEIHFSNGFSSSGYRVTYDDVELFFSVHPSKRVQEKKAISVSIYYLRRNEEPLAIGKGHLILDRNSIRRVKSAMGMSR